MPGLDLVWQAFGDLSGDRHLGMTAASSIPFSSIDAWARRYCVDDDDFSRFHYLLKEMDATLLKYKAPKEQS